MEIQNANEKERASVSIDDICKRTCMKEDDVRSTMEVNDLLMYYKGEYIYVLSDEAVKSHKRSVEKRKMRIDPKCIQWKPKDY